MDIPMGYDTMCPAAVRDRHGRKMPGRCLSNNLEADFCVKAVE
jgi:hypothetical protein